MAKFHSVTFFHASIVSFVRPAKLCFPGNEFDFEGSARLSVTLRKRDATCSFSGGQLDSDNNFDNFEN